MPPFRHHLTLHTNVSLFERFARKLQVIFVSSFINGHLRAFDLSYDSPKAVLRTHLSAKLSHDTDFVSIRVIPSSPGYLLYHCTRSDVWFDAMV